MSKFLGYRSNLFLEKSIFSGDNPGAGFVFWENWRYVLLEIILKGISAHGDLQTWLSHN